MFNTATQNFGEKIDDFVQRLRELSKSCEYGTLCDDLVRDRIVLGTSDNDLRLRMFREKALTLHKAISMARESDKGNKSPLRKSPYYRRECELYEEKEDPEN